MKDLEFDQHLRIGLFVFPSAEDKVNEESHQTKLPICEAFANLELVELMFFSKKK